MAKKKAATKLTRQAKAIQFGNGTTTDEVGLKMELKKQIHQMIASIETHIESVHSMVKRNARKTIRYLKNNIDAIDARLSNEEVENLDDEMKPTEENVSIVDTTTAQFEVRLY